MKQESSLYQKLKEYSESDRYPYHMPGHKRRQLGCLPKELLAEDITEIDGFDNLHDANGILAKAQKSANEIYGAEETFYLINGSTCGVLSAVSAALPEGGHLLMVRNCHKSVYHAVYLRHLRVSYLFPERAKNFEFDEAVTAKQVEDALEKEADIDAVLIVSPTYEGRIADVKAIAEAAHRHGIPLIVDEAHGAHLGLNVPEKGGAASGEVCGHSQAETGFAQTSCRLGADVVIHSVHKTLPAMTQTALLHVNGDLIDRERLKRFLHIYQSSSPSYVLMASINDAMEIVRGKGERLFAEFYENYMALLGELGSCKVLRFSDPEDTRQGRHDVGKLVIAGDRAGVSGQWLYDILRGRYHLQCEMAAGSYCLAMFTIADGAEAYRRMAEALTEIDGELVQRQAETGRGTGQSDMGIDGEPAQRQAETGEMSLRQTQTDGDSAQRGMEPADMPLMRYPLCEAWDRPQKKVRLTDAVGATAAEFVNLYPPGTPILVPGEILSREICEKLAEYAKMGLNLQGIIQENGECFIRVIASRPA